LHPAGAARSVIGAAAEVTAARRPANGSQRVDNPKADAAQPATPAIQADPT